MLNEIAGYRDRLGERMIVPQPSGALLEHLYFHSELTNASFFASALKDRVARLANFRHSSYARVRRVHQAIERGGVPCLVSAHNPGRRLAELLDIAEREGIRASTAAILAATRQVMTSVALLHDFGPDVFHGALGPERIILGGEGRIIISEYVLGNVVEQAAPLWGISRLWRDYRLAVRPDPGVAQFGRLTDILQVGLITLSCLSGRRLRSEEFPEALSPFLDHCTEIGQDGTEIPLRPGLRSWLERAFGFTRSSSFKSLLDAQKALSQLIQDEGFGASSVAWDGFVEECQRALARQAVVPPVVAPRDEGPAAVTEEALTPSVVDVWTGAAVAGVVADVDPAVGAPVTEVSAPSEGSTSWTSVTPVETPAAPDAGGAEAPETAPDPFGAWPVDTPTRSVASLLEAFQTEGRNDGPLDFASFPTPAPGPGTGAPEFAVTSDASLAAPAGEVGSAQADHPERPTPAARPSAQDSSRTLFHAPPLQVEVVTVGEDPWAPAPASSVYAEAVVHQPGDVDAVVVDAPPESKSARGWNLVRVARPQTVEERRRVLRLLVLAALTLVGAVAVVYAPAMWTLLYEGPVQFGQATIKTDPAGAVVTIDGTVRGRTPVALTLRAGPHSLEVQNGGSVSAKLIVVPADGAITEQLAFPNASARGGLRVSTYPVPGKVTIDGVVRGDAPVKVGDLMPGSHVLLVETALGAQEQDVVVEAGTISPIAVPTASWVKVTAPFELKVVEDGRSLGTTGSAPVMMGPGGHRLEFVNQPLGVKLPHYVDLPPGQLVEVPLDLPMGMMNLYADDPAEVSVDGKVVGETPLSGLPATLGSHEVVFRHKRYGEVRYTVMVTLAAPVGLNVKFIR